MALEITNWLLLTIASIYWRFCVSHCVGAFVPWLLYCAQQIRPRLSPVTLVLVCLLDSIIYCTQLANFHDASIASAPILWFVENSKGTSHNPGTVWALWQNGPTILSLGSSHSCSSSPLIPFSLLKLPSHAKQMFSSITSSEKLETWSVEASSLRCPHHLDLCIFPSPFPLSKEGSFFPFMAHSPPSPDHILSYQAGTSLPRSLSVLHCFMFFVLVPPLYPSKRLRFLIS